MIRARGEGRARRFCLAFWLLALLLSPQSRAQAQAGAGGSEPAPATEAPATEAAPTVVATWKGGTVSEAELARWLRFQRRDQEPKRRRQADPRRSGTEDPLERRRQDVEAMLLIETLAATARERGVEDRPAIQRAFESTEEQILAAAFKSHRRDQITISDAEVEAFLRRFPDTLKRPRKVRLRSITKRFAPDAGTEDKAALRRRMEEIRAVLAAGADFATVARRESETQSRFQGGLIGNVPAGKLRPEVDAVAMALKPGELSKILETGDGLTVLHCEKIIEAFEPSPEEQLRDTEPHLRRRGVKRDWENVQAELLRQAPPTFDLEAARGASAKPGDVVARFEGGTLTRGDLLAALRSGPATRDVGDLSDQALRRRLERLVVRALAAHRARGLELDRDPELIERLDWQRRQVLAGDELSRRIQAQLEPPTEQEIRAYFEAHPRRFQRPAQFDLAVIQVDLVAGEERQTYRRADELRQQLAAGELDFAGAARAHSVHPSAKVGGALGWFSGQQLAGFGPLVHRNVSRLAAGETSELLQREQSLFILRMNDRREARRLTWEEASAAAEARLGRERVAEIQERIEQEIRAGLEVRLLPVP